MSKWGKELQNLLSWPAVISLLYYAALLVFILQSQEQRNLFYLNEMAMLPFVVMLTYMWFQREIGSGLMEMLSTYPSSLTGMVLRKWLLVHVTVLVCHALLMAVYVWHLGPPDALMYAWDGGEMVRKTAAWWELYVQAFPGYVTISALTVFGFALGKQVYGGLGLSFAYWMLEGLTAGSLTRDLGLYTAYLPHAEWFWLNRLLLMAIGVMLCAAALVLVNRRSRWIVTDTDS